MAENPTPSEENQEAADDATVGEPKTNLGTTQNVAGLLAYVLMWLTGIIFLLTEKENDFVRFHAMQSIVIFVPLTIASMIVGFLPIIGGLVGVILQITTIIIWLFMMYQAFQGNRYKLPYAGEFAETQLKNMSSK
ncbi:DUF4870 domain-containing protein [Dehalococcoides mccartyi]|nr:DUF4870 domain-containing protein [Dehalococcoides mccartyi]